MSATEAEAYDCYIEHSLAASPRVRRSSVAENKARQLRILAFNVERGLQLAPLCSFFAELDPKPDIVLLSELDRNCARTNSEFVAQRLTRALGPDYSFVYGVEFAELGAGQ